MPATVTLATATLTYGIDSGASEVQLSDVSGVLPGYRLFIDRELMKVREVVAETNRVKVFRGQDSTAASRHSSSATVTIGRADQFYFDDPTGSPAAVIPVSPYINAINGRVWLSQGDAIPVDGSFRYWQEVTGTYSTGALGIVTQTSAPTSST